MRTFLSDIRYACRQMMKSPGFAMVAVLTLALGIGANTAIFSVVNAVLLEPLPYPDSNRLFVLFHSKHNFVKGSISYPNFLDWQRENHSFEAMAAYRHPGGFTLTGAGEAENLTGSMVSAGFWEILGVKPVLGRTFGPDEDRLGANPVVMISEELWRRKFAANPHIVGQAIVLDGKARTIVGVIPAGFSFVRWNFRSGDAYLPIGEFSEPHFRYRSAAWGTNVVARLKPGVSLAQADEDMARVNRGLAAAYPNDDADMKSAIFPLKEQLIGPVRPVLLVLMGAVLFVLLIACVNVANLQLARSTARRREFAVRVALGAAQGRLIRQVLTESLVLAFTGGAFGLLLAYWGAKAALAAVPESLPRAQNVGLNGHVLAFTLLASALAGVVFGLAPAFRTSRTDVNATLNQSGRSLVGSPHRAQAIFVTAEMAMALVLLVGAGLMIRTLTRLWSVSPGFDPHNVITFDITPSHSLQEQSPAAIRAAFRQMATTLHSVPGVEEVSFDYGAMPMNSDWEDSFWTDNMARPEHDADLPYSLRYGVGPEYLKLMHIPLVRGRFIGEQDTESASRIAVIDESFAARFFPGEDPIGKHLHFVERSTGGPRVDEIVGVVGHIKQFGLVPDAANSVEPQYYEPFQQSPDLTMREIAQGVLTFVRTREGVDPASIFPAIRGALRQQDSDMVVDDLEPMEKTVADSIARQRFAMLLFSVFAAGALLLASVGIYGVLSYVVGQRTREIGIRMALGAGKGDVKLAVLRDGAGMTLPGIGLGVMLALALAHLMSAMLFGVHPTDALTFASVAVLLLLVALVACYVPARRAAALDPMQALRTE